MPDGFSHGIVEIRSGDAPDSPYFISVGLHVLRTIGNRPRGVFETPRLNGAEASGAIPVTGWATDDIGIARINPSGESVHHIDGRFGWNFRKGIHEQPGLLQGERYLHGQPGTRDAGIAYQKDTIPVMRNTEADQCLAGAPTGDDASGQVIFKGGRS